MLFHGALINDIINPFVDDLSKNAAACLLTLEKDLASMISAHNYYPEIGRVVMYVDVEQEFFRDARDADRRPSLSILHRRVRIDVVKQHSYV